MITLEKAVLANAAGMVKNREQAERLLDSSVNRVVVGSITKDGRVGNIGETYYYDERNRTGYNSKGMDNLGIERTRRWLSGFRRECDQHGKKLVINVAGFSPDEYGDLAHAVLSEVDYIEINVGCGNIWDGGKQKAIPSYDPALLRRVLGNVNVAVGNARRVIVKLSPIGSELIPAVAEVLNLFPSVREVITCNTKPNQSHTRPDGSPALAFRETEEGEVKHTGGMSGSGLKPDSLRVVRELRPLLRHDIGIIGCGGIMQGSDLLEYLEAGAEGGAIGTGFFECGPRIFSEVLGQAAELVPA